MMPDHYFIPIFIKRIDKVRLQPHPHFALSVNTHYVPYSTFEYQIPVPSNFIGVDRIANIDGLSLTDRVIVVFIARNYPVKEF